MKRTTKMLPVILLGGLLAMSSSAQMPELAEQWQTFGTPVPGNESVNPGWAGAMFYRPAGAGGPAANIYVNGEYLASLLPGGYRYAELCPYNQRLASAYTGQDTAYNIKAGAGEFYDLPQGYVSFFRVVDSGVGPTLQAVNRATAGQELGQLREQIH